MDQKATAQQDETDRGADAANEPQSQDHLSTKTAENTDEHQSHV